AEDGIRDRNVTGVQTCALPISGPCTGQRSYRPARHSCGADPAEGPVCRLCIGQTGGHRLEVGSVKEVQMKLHASGEDYLEAILRSEERRVGKGGRCGWRQGRSK